jgi:hypothetical protein
MIDEIRCYRNFARLLFARQAKGKRKLVLCDFSPTTDTEPSNLRVSTRFQAQLTVYCMSAENVTVNTLIERLWIAPENAEWKPKTDILPLNDLKEWMHSGDIEVWALSTL